MTTSDMVMPKPGTRVINIGADGRPSIKAYRCGECGAVVTEQTMACRACASRNAPEPFEATDKGKVHSWTTVLRSYPGVEVPFVSAIVDLDDGLTLKGTIKGVDGDAVRGGMPVRLVFDDAGGAHDKEGVPYVGYHFVSEGDA